MMEKPENERAIVGLTKWTYDSVGRHTYYGVDDEGVERIYAEFANEEDHESWRQTDPLWKEAQERVFRRFLSHPDTADGLIELNMWSSLEKGDVDTAASLMMGLSPQRYPVLMLRLEQAAAMKRKRAEDEERIQASLITFEDVPPDRLRVAWGEQYLVPTANEHKDWYLKSAVRDHGVKVVSRQSPSDLEEVQRRLQYRVITEMIAHPERWPQGRPLRISCDDQLKAVVDRVLE